MRKPSKGPQGGAGMLFLAGFGLEMVVALVAFRALVGDVSRDLLQGGRDEPVTRPARAPEPAGLSGAAAPAGPAADPSPVVDPSLAGTVDRSDAAEALAEAVALCSSLKEPTDAGATLLVQLSISGDGTVTAVDAVGISRAYAACVEAEAGTWRLPGTGQPIQIWRTLALD